jgi:hypothetical protein
MYHLRETSEQLAAPRPHSEMAELPREDSPRIDSSYPDVATTPDPTVG